MEPYEKLLEAFTKDTIRKIDCAELEELCENKVLQKINIGEWYCYLHPMFEKRYNDFTKRKLTEQMAAKDQVDENEYKEMIQMLHLYNTFKDKGTAILGTIAEGEEVSVKSLYEKFEIEED